jgi:hypothetical protein
MASVDAASLHVSSRAQTRSLQPGAALAACEPKADSHPQANCHCIRCVVSGGDSNQVTAFPYHSQEIMVFPPTVFAAGLIRIEFRNVAAAIMTKMPARLSVICMASPSEISISTMWPASASRTPMQ